VSPTELTVQVRKNAEAKRELRDIKDAWETFYVISDTLGRASFIFLKLGNCSNWRGVMTYDYRGA
jgi:hypothetical protein